MYPPQLARKVWLGKWNSKRDREPDKSDENAFKNFLISKYERRTWYVDPKEAVKKEEKTTPKPEPKLLPPPTSKVGVASLCSWSICCCSKMVR